MNTNPTDSSVDILVEDLETITMTRAELERAIESAKNAAWADARRQFQGKRERNGDLVARIDRLERIVANHLDQSFVGQAAPLSTQPRKASDHE